MKHYLCASQSPNWRPKELILIKGKKLLTMIPKLYSYLKSERKRKCARLVWIMEYFKSLRSTKRMPLITIDFLAKLTEKIRSLNSRKGSKRYRWSYKEMLDYYTKRIMPEPRQVIFDHIKATPEPVQKAKKMHEEGLSYRKIGENLCISHTTASLWCALT